MRGYDIIESLKTRPNDWAEFSSYMNTCKAVESAKDLDNLEWHYENGLTYMAMTDYPVASDFLNPEPAWAVNVSCEVYKNWTYSEFTQKYVPSESGLSDHEKKFLKGLNDVANVYLNYSGQTPCLNTSDTDASGNYDANGWWLLACNQLAQPISDGAGSMFNSKNFSYEDYTKTCQEKYGLTPDFTWASRVFGGQNQKKDFESFSNIIYTYGNLDPWTYGGVLDFVNVNTPMFMIKGGAHHLDIREPTDADKGTDVEWVRD